jgi:hypothetical protein
MGVRFEVLSNAGNVEEARAAATRIVKDGTHTAEIISRIRGDFLGAIRGQ